jgi:hypothetical protein
MVDAPTGTGGRILWDDTFDAGRSTVLADGAGGVFVVPLATSGEIEGTLVAHLDEAGFARWVEATGSAAGASSASVDPGGGLWLTPVNYKPKPPTPDEVYDSNFLERRDARGRRLWLRQIGGASVQLVLVRAGASGAVVAGTVSGTARLGARAVTDGPFVAAVDAQGTVRWASPVEGGIFDLTIDRAGAVRVATMMAESGDVTVLGLDDGGARASRVVVPVGRQGVAPTLDPRGGLVWARDAGSTERRDEGVDVIATDATGHARWQRRVPGMTDDCTLAVAGDGAVVAACPRAVHEIDGAGRLAWSATTAWPCGVTSGDVTGIAVDDTSVTTVISCLGVRIGTMMNSNYSRAYSAAFVRMTRISRR